MLGVFSPEEEVAGSTPAASTILTILISIGYRKGMTAGEPSFSSVGLNVGLNEVVFEIFYWVLSVSGYLEVREVRTEEIRVDLKVEQVGTKKISRVLGIE